MSSRALRKAQREREEQERLEKLEHEEQEGSEDETAPTQSTQKSAFAMLADDEDDDEAEEASDNHEQHKIDEEETHEVPVDSIPKSISKKKKRKKKRSKANTSTPDHAPENDEENLDEIDKALRDLSTNGDASQPATTAAGVNTETDELCKLLAIDSAHLHAQNEMRRLFGRDALSQDADDEDGPPQADNIGGNRRQQRQVQRLGLAQALRQRGPGGRGGALSQMALKRNIFVQGKEEWPNATSGGLGMEIDAKNPDGTVVYRFLHNRVYQEVQSQFEIAVESMDPNRLVVMLQQNPYHVSTLLQVSEIAKSDRENAMAGDLLERALFTFGRAVHSSFSKNLAEGKARLDFSSKENREFWLAGWRYMQNLSMRATWRTVYEWARLLLSLSPDEDPYGMLLVLDQYALRSRQDIDYLNLARTPAFKDRFKHMPNSQLSQGQAEFRAGNQGKGKQALYTAVGKFPWVVARLMQELGQQPPPAIWGKEPRTEREKLEAELYATRSKDLWSAPEASALLMEVASALPPDTPAAEPEDAEITLAEARHVLLSDTPALTALIPRKYTAMLTSSSDPLPPNPTSSEPQSYDELITHLDDLNTQYSELSTEILALLRRGPNRPQSLGELSPDYVQETLRSLPQEQQHRLLRLFQRLQGLEMEQRRVRMEGARLGGEPREPREPGGPGGGASFDGSAGELERMMRQAQPEDEDEDLAAAIAASVADQGNGGRQPRVD